MVEVRSVDFRSWSSRHVLSLVPLAARENVQSWIQQYRIAVAHCDDDSMRQVITLIALRLDFRCAALTALFVAARAQSHQLLLGLFDARRGRCVFEHAFVR